MVSELLLLSHFQQQKTVIRYSKILRFNVDDIIKSTTQSITQRMKGVLTYLCESFYSSMMVLAGCNVVATKYHKAERNAEVFDEPNVRNMAAVPAIRAGIPFGLPDSFLSLLV